MPNLRTYDPLVLVTSFSWACLARIIFVRVSRGSASVYAKQSTHLSQIHAIVSNPARTVQHINAGGIGPDLEGKRAVIGVQAIAGHGIGVLAGADIANGDSLIAADRQTDDGIAFTAVVIPYKAHATTPLVDLTHGRFLQGWNATADQIQSLDMSIQRMRLGGGDIRR